MDFFEQLKKNVTQAGQTAVDKAKKAADLLKLREQIRQDKREIRDITYRIGKTYISLHKDDYEKEYEKYFTALEKVKEALAEKEKELQKMQEKIRCTECGAEISPSDDYCPKCGAAVAYETELKEEKVLDSEEEEDDIEDDFFKMNKGILSRAGLLQICRLCEEQYLLTTSTMFLCR